MQILKRTQGIDLKAKTGVIRGEVNIQLRDALTGKIAHEESGHNMLTNGLNNALNQCPFGLNKIDASLGDVGGSMLTLTPLYSQLLGGVFLFPSALGNDADLLYPPFSNSPTGFASMSDYTQTDSRQGTYDAVSSGVITNGFKYVFSWGSAYGNGTIASLGLSTRNCHTWLKERANMIKPFQASSGNVGFYRARSGYTRLLAISESGSCFIKGTSSTLGYTDLYFFKQIRPFTLNIMENVRLNDLDFDNAYSDTYRNGYTWKISNVNFGSFPLQFTVEIIGSYVYVITHSAGSFTVKKYDIADGTLVSTDTYSFSGDFGSGNAVLYGNYIYCIASVANKILKANINNVADVTEITATGVAANGVLFFVNTQFIYSSYGILDAESDIFQSMDAPLTYALDQWYTYPVAEYGNWLIFNGGNNTCASMKQWGLMTHYDLQSAVNKTADKQMLVQYSITQV